MRQERARKVTVVLTDLVNIGSDQLGDLGHGKDFAEWLKTTLEGRRDIQVQYILVEDTPTVEPIRYEVGTR